ncbi:UvrB/uvrC motif protein [Botrimarina colliarenosi]|uniref:UvrB/uvrC motif protein n=1 Tax=Botrimarina colliarenosi TaxID=2528001 RepID=A0A5C6A0S7_9BACT|nr:UvrB/UvrC motif-containing protein [Botrimarina colliarenosi]TWT93434.1 UvrB/uvrC motif protein [Botrimarina colliarenosi]
MTLDIRSTLRDWGFNPDEVTVRTIEGDDGLEKIQLRLDLGLMQMEVDGRPDGERVEGFDSWFELHRDRQRQHDAENPDGAPYRLKPEDCANLLREGVQYYHRYVSFWALSRYELCARDTERNLQLILFVRDHAKLERDKLQFDQWRPYVAMMHARAVATPMLEAGHREAAIQAIDIGVHRIERFLADYGREEQADQVNELSFLLRWRREIADGGKRKLPKPEDYVPDDPLDQLRERLAEAIEAERYEEAANLRDELNRLENPPPPGG